uniref:Uncharacterized protein n=1 Tax=viral metagenome TaxID=1070528 RepID=A0A6M3IYK0_9ZZZZ
MIVSRWFDKELKLIDPLYFAEWNEDMLYWEIKRKMTAFYTDRSGRIEVKVNNPTVGVFKHLNDEALENLRERKWLSRRYPGDSYITWLFNQAKEAKAKKEQMGLEMAAEGMLRIFSTKQTFDMAASPKEKSND